MASILSILHLLRALLGAFQKIRRLVDEHQYRRKFVRQQRARSRKLLEKLRIARRRRDAGADRPEQLRKDDGFRRD